VLVLTPVGRDAELIRERIVAVAMSCDICADLQAMLAGIYSAGTFIIAQEALSQSDAEALVSALQAQEAWSDIPVLFLFEAPSKRGRHSLQLAAHFQAIFGRSNVILLQRPVHPQFLMSSIRAAVATRRRQYQVRDLHRELARAVQLSDMFVSMLGHDLRTPLGAITLSAQTIVRLSPDARALRPAGRILTSAEYMARMIEQLLDLARVRRGRGIPLTLRRVHLGELCQQATQELEDANPHAKLHCREVGDLTGTWDPDRLRQVMSNLVGNAVKHGTKDKPIIVEVEGSERSTVRVSVRNFGTVADEQLPTIFEAFKPAKPGRTGLGLGLFIAREIARAHGGELTIQTAEGQTILEVTLPRQASVVEPRHSP
jgi:signal transduction histidine kinase